MNQVPHIFQAHLLDLLLLLLSNSKALLQMSVMARECQRGITILGQRKLPQESRQLLRLLLLLLLLLSKLPP
jgi:hypothetical protein